MKYILEKIDAFSLNPYQIFIWFNIAFIAGIAFASYTKFGFNSSQYLYLFIIGLLLFCAFVNFLLKNRILVFASFAVIFFIAALISSTKFNSANFCSQNLAEENIELTATVLNNPEPELNNQKVILGATSGDCRKFGVLATLPRYPELEYGDIIKLSGKLAVPGMIDDFNYANYLKPKKVSYIMQNPRQSEIIGRNNDIKTAILRPLYRFKKNFESAINRSLGEPEASLAAGIITGSKRTLSDDLTKSLQSSGLTHIVALSGYNVTIIIVALSALMGGVLHKRQILFFGSILAIFFILMTGAAPSVVRAGIISLLILFGQSMGKKAYMTNILLLAASLMLFFNPYLLLYDTGFQLSFLAFCGLIYLSRPLKKILTRSRLNILPENIKGMLSETLSAQIAVLPLIAATFGRVSLIAPLSNVLVLGVIPLAMLLAAITGFLGMISAFLGVMFGLVAWPVLSYIVLVSKYSAELPLSSITVAGFSQILLFFIYIILIVYLIGRDSRQKKWLKQL